MMRPTLLGCGAGAGAGAALLFSGGAVATAGSTGTSHVVPRTAQVAGRSYGYWLQRSWQETFDAAPPAAPCQTLSAGGARVAYLTLGTLDPGAHHYTCNASAGEPLYVVGLSNECSTFAGDHHGFGTTDRQLVACARAGFMGAQDTTTLDGQPVDTGALITATRAFKVVVPEHNPYRIAAGSGESAAYGFGLALTALPRGTHTIDTHWKVGSAKWHLTFTVRVG